MIIYVRTTLVIDGHVLVEAKRQAIEAGLTVSEWTTLALPKASGCRWLLPGDRHCSPRSGVLALERRSCPDVGERSCPLEPMTVEPAGHSANVRHAPGG